MIKTKDELLEIIRGRVGEDTSDEAISYLEDVTDTLEDYESRVADSTDWKAKYEENDANWRRKYIDRFSGNTDPTDGDNELVVTEASENTEVKETPMTYEDLFA